MQLNAFALVIFSTVPCCHIRFSFLVSIIRSKVCTKFSHPFPLVWNRSSPVTPCVFRILFQLFQTFGTPQSYIGVYVFFSIYNVVKVWNNWNKNTEALAATGLKLFQTLQKTWKSLDKLWNKSLVI